MERRGGKLHKTVTAVNCFRNVQDLITFAKLF